MRYPAQLPSSSLAGRRPVREPARELVRELVCYLLTTCQRTASQQDSV